MNRREKQKLLELLIKKQDTANLRPIDSYKPHDKQLLFHKSQKKVRLLCGGNRSGKTHSGVAEDVWLATGTHPYRHTTVPNVGWICGTDFPNGIKGTLQPKLDKMLPKGSVSKITTNSQGVPTYYLKNGSVIYFKSYDQDVDKFESAAVDWIHFDEPPPKRIFDACIRGLVDRNGCCHLTLTPISEAWIYADLWIKGAADNPDIDCFKMSIYDNPYISSEGIKFLIDFTGTDYLASRLSGEFLELHGRVFKKFNRDTHVIDGWAPVRGMPVYMGIDPHVYGRKNQAALWVTLTPENDIVCFKEIWKDLTIPAFRDEIITTEYHKQQDGTVVPKWDVICRVADNSVNVREALTHQNYREIMEAPGKYGVKMNFFMASKKGLVAPGIEYINTLLELREDPKLPGQKFPRLLVTKDCTRLIQELELHGWKDFRHPEKAGIAEMELPTYNDMISVLRYILSLDPSYVRKRNYLNLSGADKVTTYGGQ